MKESNELFLKELNDKIINKIPFAFSRWGDGEWFTVDQDRVWDSNCDGNVYYKDLGERLKDIASNPQPYYMGHQHGTNNTAWPQKWVNSDIWHDLSIERGMKEIFDILDNVHVVFIGNESLSALPFINEFIEIPYKNVWLQYNEILEKIKSKIRTNEHKLFLFAGGMASNVFIHDLWMFNKENSFMDASSAFDPYVGRNSRGYHNRLNNIHKVYEKNVKVGYTFAFHHSEEIRPAGKEVTQPSVVSFYDHCKYNFDTYVIDNESIPKTSFSEIVDTSTENLHYTYVEDQYKKGLTGAWDLGVRQAVEDGCDIILLSGDDIVFDNTINKLIEHIENDKDSDNSVYGPLASGITNKIQLADKPNDEIKQIVGHKWLQHLGGHLYAFTKEFYHKWKQPNGELFIINQPHNGGDGKWGGNEGNVMYWAEQGAKCFIVGTCHVHHQIETRRSWAIAKHKDGESNEK
jgi:hypothetical protein